MTREELYNQGLELAKQNTRLAFLWSTGVGKSKMAIGIANYLSENNTELKILLVVAETAHKDNWKEEFKKWKLNKKISITIECYASLKNYQNTQWDLIIFDEAHHLGSDLRLEMLRTISAQHIILLSATLQDQLLYALQNIFGQFKVSKVTLQDAIQWGILPEPKIYLYALTLDNTRYTETIIEEWGKKNKEIPIHCTYSQRWEYIKNRKKYPNIKLIISCTQQQKYDYLTTQFNHYKTLYLNTRQINFRNKWMQAGSVRKRFLGECKTVYVEHLINEFRKKNKRFICFCSSIKQAELLGSLNAIHSKKSDSLNTINDFNEKKINSLFAIGMLQEGQNLVDIQAGIIVQLDGQERAFIQKSGRVYRAEDPIQCIFYYKNTRDEEYLNKAIENIDASFIYKKEIKSI